MERTCLKRGYGLMDGAIGKVSGVHRLSVLLIVSEFSRRLNCFFYKRLAATGVAPCSFCSYLYHVQPDPVSFPYVGIARHQAAQQAAQNRQKEAGSRACSATLTQGEEGVVQAGGEGAEGVRGGSVEGGGGKGMAQSGGGGEVHARGEGEGQGAWHVHRV